MGHLHRAQLAHPFFALFLLFQKLLFPGDVAAVALGQNVLAHGLYRFPGNDLAAYRRLNGYLEQLARNMLFQVFRHLAGAGIGFVRMDDEA